MQRIKDIFSEFTSLPYLFIGSGISRRYLNLPDWEGLLRYFIDKISKENLAFEYYKNNAIKKLNELNEDDKSLVFPMIATLVENDFNERWFTSDEFKENRAKYQDEISSGATPFKVEVSNYLKTSSKDTNLLKEYQDEIELIKQIADKSINGIITTNYDLLIENLFENKDYDCFIGQEDLIFSPINGVREIYKIHGCCSNAKSLVITYKDYKDFRKKNAYIAAKLLTTFIEHPIIFFGYSIDDQNIISILESIVTCLTENKIKELKNRLFFVQRNKEKDFLEVTDIVRQFNKSSIPMKSIKVNDFSIIYEALLDVKAKYNPRFMKMLKNDIYNLVVSNEAKGRLIATTDIEDDDLSKVDVVVGVGLKDLAKNGIVGISGIDIFKDIILDNFDWLSIEEFKTEFVQNTLPNELARNAYSLPVFKYIDTTEKLPEKIECHVGRQETLDSFLSEVLKNKKNNKTRKETVNSILEKYKDLDTQMLKIAILDEEEINLSDLKTYLINTYEDNKNIFESKHKTNIRRLIKIYDFLKYKK